MAMESFTELLHKLKDVHEHELEGLHQKVLELTNKKNCDAKRLEELYNRNQQLREQHKMLTENIKQLENMLRAGLCDRCTVTQEMAKKRQQDYESSHLQSLQHISILMGEISALMKENERLKEEVKSLRGRLEQQNGHKEEASSPEVKLCPDPAAMTLTQTTSVLKNDQTAPGGATTPTATVKTEPERRLSLAQREETPDKASEHKLVQGWSGTPNFEMTKLTNLATSQAPWRERRAASVESLDPRQSPTTLPFPPHLRLIKNNSLFSPQRSEERPVAVSVPLRPHPIKTSPATLPWRVPEQSEWVTVNSESSSIMVHSNLKHDFSPTILRLPSLVPSECRPPVQSLVFPRPVCPPTMSLCERLDGQIKKAAAGDWTSSQPERIFGENLRKGEEEAPLDLSNVGGSKLKEKEKDSASSSSSSPPAPLSSPSSAQYASSPQSNPQAGDSKSQREDTSERYKDDRDAEKEKNENVDIENLKVPTLTISLRPVVVLESLKSAGQKEEEMEQDSQLQDQHMEDESNQGIIRKRSGQIPEALPRRSIKLKRTRMTVVAPGPNNGDSDQG
ncbi:zinc finger protein jing homolog [Trichomycterus rosablanca]|uniref:zinc finger protein jing homolog n=1 Tax=Trichomycterus rosablanca TaxID=2290929 RepID=UPI002F35DAC9